MSKIFISGNVCVVNNRPVYYGIGHQIQRSIPYKKHTCLQWLLQSTQQHFVTIIMSFKLPKCWFLINHNQDYDWAARWIETFPVVVFILKLDILEFSVSSSFYFRMSLPHELYHRPVDLMQYLCSPNRTAWPWGPSQQRLSIIIQMQWKLRFEF